MVPTFKCSCLSGLWRLNIFYFLTFGGKVGFLNWFTLFLSLVTCWLQQQHQQETITQHLEKFRVHSAVKSLDVTAYQFICNSFLLTRRSLYLKCSCQTDKELLLYALWFIIMKYLRINYYDLFQM